jgi:hypothetical protein
MNYSNITNNRTEMANLLPGFLLMELNDAQSVHDVIIINPSNHFQVIDIQNSMIQNLKLQK